MTNLNNIRLSPSEQHGIDAMSDNDVEVYSVGVSTGGQAEIAMAESKSRHIIATTIDPAGAEATKDLVAKKHLGDNITVKLENVAEPLPYNDKKFDYIYARLVLHYLPDDKLVAVLSELKRVLKTRGKLFIVVRSDKCGHVGLADSVFDPETRLTEYTDTNPAGDKVLRIKRHFFSEDELAKYLKNAGLNVQYITSFDESLFKDFGRTVPSDRRENLVEALATKNQ